MRTVCWRSKGGAKDGKPQEKEHSVARRDMRTLLEINDLTRREPIKLLFSGHTGSGKSTESNKLCEDLDDRFFVVRVSTRDLVQPTDLTYVDYCEHRH